MALRVEWLGSVRRTVLVDSELLGNWWNRIDWGGTRAEVATREVGNHFAGLLLFPSTKNNQLRTGADKGNPTV